MRDTALTPIPGHWQPNADLAALTTFAVPARARWLVQVEQEDELPAVLAIADAHDLPVLVLGGGSNLLFVADYPGVVIKLALRGVRARVADGQVRVTAAAGENWHGLVEYCLRHGWYGLENLALIPGSVGAAPVQNIGAYGVEIAERLESVRYLDLELMRVSELSAEQCQLAYRDSIFKQALKGRAIILAVTLRLSTRAEPVLHYPALRDALAAVAERAASNTQRSGGAEGAGGSVAALDIVVSPQQVFDAVCAVRRSKLPDPAVLGNAGSFFRNPVISQSQFAQLRTQWPDLPGYPAAGDLVKLPAAWLIERAGWKGVRRGTVGVHDKQALVLVHDFAAGAASGAFSVGSTSAPLLTAGAQLLALARDIARDVKRRFAVVLEPEVQIVPASAWSQP